MTATRSSWVRRSRQSASTSPVCTSSAAISAWVPWRIYSNSLALDGLNASLLVDAEYHRVSRGLAVQLANHIDLLTKGGIRTVKPLLDSVWAHVAGLQDSLHMAAADLFDNAALDRARHYPVQRWRNPSLGFVCFTCQRNQLQSRFLRDAWRTAATLTLAQALPTVLCACATCRPSAPTRAAPERSPYSGVLRAPTARCAPASHLAEPRSFARSATGVLLVLFFPTSLALHDDLGSSRHVSQRNNSIKLFTGCCTSRVTWLRLAPVRIATMRVPLEGR
ncbi:hypothetical protein OKW33_006699 [Paraburkholderia atlantica]